MAKKQLTDAPDTVLVEALVKTWNADEIVPAGAVYPLPVAVANDLAGRGMVRIIGGAVEDVEVVAFDLATENEDG